MQEMPGLVSRKVAWVAVCLVLAGAACADTHDATTTTETVQTAPTTTQVSAGSDEVQGTWVLERMTVAGQPYAFPVQHPRGDTSVDGPAVFIFQDGTVWGEAPCNGFDGTYQQVGDSLLWDVIHEAFACADRSWNRADEFIFSLFSVESVGVELSGAHQEVLELSGSGVVLTLRRS